MENAIPTIAYYLSVFRSVCKFIKPYLRIIHPTLAILRYAGNVHFTEYLVLSDREL